MLDHLQVFERIGGTDLQGATIRFKLLKRIV
jgi:hypothetical protein